MTSEQLSISANKNGLAHTVKNRTDAEINKPDDVATKFEALLIFTMMKSMRASLTEDTLAGSKQQDMYREMMDRQIAESIAKNGSFGLQSLFEQQLSSNPGADNQTGDQKLISSLDETDTARSSIETATSALEFIARQRAFLE